MSSTDLAYVLAVCSGLPWRCITPFGRPVVPDEYSQKPLLSRAVDATSASDESVKSVDGVDADARDRLGGAGGRRVLDHDDVLDRRCDADDRSGVRDVGTRDHERLGAGVGGDRTEVGAAQHRRQRHGHDARTHRAEEPRRERRFVTDDHDDPVALADAERGERVLGPPDLGEQILVGQRLAAATERHTVATTGADVPIDEPLGGVVPIPHRFNSFRRGRTRSRRAVGGCRSTAARPIRPSSRARAPRSSATRREPCRRRSGGRSLLAIRLR